MAVCLGLLRRHPNILWMADKRTEQVRQVLRLLNDVGVTLNFKKCRFFTNLIDYPGHDIRPGRLEGLAWTSNAVQDLENQTNLAEIRSFFALRIVFGPIVPTITGAAAPLKRKLQEGQQPTFPCLSDGEITDLETLKEKLIEPPVLVIQRSQADNTV